MNLPDGANCRADAHSYRFACPFVTVTSQPFAPPEAERGRELGGEEIALLAERRGQSDVGVALGFHEVVFEFHKPRSVGRTCLAIEHRAGVAIRDARGRPTGCLHEIQNVNLSARNGDQCGEVSHAL